MIDQQQQNQASTPDRQERPESAAVFLAGISTISGAIVGVTLAGHFSAAAGMLAFSLLAAWVGWLARGLHE